mmetsp:Transcript_8879/g.23004  ORF Transcript_8879/g.23004 Transcript_8879/m.23004 type:complete len:320 (-) Transcript_8879:9-968(-)
MPAVVQAEKPPFGDDAAESTVSGAGRHAGHQGEERHGASECGVGDDLWSLCAGDEGEELEVFVAGSRFLLRQLPFASCHVVKHKGGTLWPCGKVLAQLIALRLEQRLVGRSVVELGCGCCALPGLVAARIGARVTLTDFREVVDVARRNAERNGLEIAGARPLCWGPRPPSWENEAFEFVFATDVLYDPSLHESLAATLDWACATGGEVYLAVQGRGGTPSVFFSDCLPRLGWTSCRLDLDDVFDALGSNATFRQSFEVWMCSRGVAGASGDSAHTWDAGLKMQGGCSDGGDSDPPEAPPETESENSDNDLPPLAPLEE